MAQVSQKCCVLDLCLLVASCRSWAIESEWKSKIQGQLSNQSLNWLSRPNIKILTTGNITHTIHYYLSKGVNLGVWGQLIRALLFKIKEIVG